VRVRVREGACVFVFRVFVFVRACVCTAALGMREMVLPKKRCVCARD